MSNVQIGHSTLVVNVVESELNVKSTSSARVRDNITSTGLK